MAYTATMLAWSVYEYKDGYVQSGQLDEILDNIRWATDYFVKAHTAPNELWGQVGNGTADHNWWGPAEVMPMARPAYKIDAAHPGSDLAGETAAALASASIIFRDSDPAYADKLLLHAKQLYNFADTYRGAYSDTITDAKQYYNSWSSYADELSWGGVWLYLATGEQTYLDKAVAASDLWGTNQAGDWGYQWTQSWDDKHYGAQLLLSRITEDPKFIQSTERNMQFWTTGVNGTSDRVAYTPGGLAHLDQWGALRYAANHAFLAFVYADWVTDPVKKIPPRPSQSARLTICWAKIRVIAAMSSASARMHLSILITAPHTAPGATARPLRPTTGMCSTAHSLADLPRPMLTPMRSAIMSQMKLQPITIQPLPALWPG